MRNIQDEPHKHLSLNERVEIYTLVQQGKSLREIGEKVGRNVGTISRELKRNKSRCDLPYTPVKAHENAARRAVTQRSKAPLKDHETYFYVKEKLVGEKWSPETIAGRIKTDKPGLSICHETIYEYIYSKGRRHKLWTHLAESRQKRRRWKGRIVRKDKPSSKIPGAVSILKRPACVDKRKTEGHIETDLMEGVRSEKPVLSVEVFRKTRYTQLTKLPNKKAETKEKILTKKLKMVRSLQKSNRPILKSITADNGSENTNHQKVSKELKTKVFFCQPYHSWEKGTVENTIKRIRRFIPKGTPLSQFNDIQIQWLENKMNNTPRKCLNYLTPNEAFEKEVNSYKFRKYRKSKEASVAFRARM